MKFSGNEIATIVRDDVVRHAEPTGDALEEFDGCGGRLIGNWYGFYPFSGLVDGDQEVCMTAR